MKQKLEGEFNVEYKKLNKEQKEAVDTIEGPVMVVAGPGTGKTQILALRIGNILLKTDTPADGILCLTFTNAGVFAMKERLSKYIGATSSKINIFTFHSFGMKIIEEYYGILELETAPKLLDDTDIIILYDELLFDHEWEYLRSRADSTRHFGDLKSLISIFKKDRISPQNFLKEIENDIYNLKNDPKSISIRGESKGEIKKDIVRKIEGLNRTLEVAKFFELYEKTKKEKNVFDYDDVLENLVRIAEISPSFCADIREKYIYVLIDEHQDSSGVQNEFLEKIWGEVEKPNIFVVGDDRQLIYGFGGASIAYFEGFKHSFGKAKLITLVDNYRSTQVILDASDSLLKSSLSTEKLLSHRKETHPVRLVEADYPRDEIIACALDIQKKISAQSRKNKINVNDCAILVPKNKQARSAALILRDMSLPVSSLNAFLFFDSDEAQSYLRVLKIIGNPYDSGNLALSFFDKLSGLDLISAHKFITENDMKKFSLINLAEQKTSLFKDTNPANSWTNKLLFWLKESQKLNVYSLTQLIGDELLLKNASDHETLISRVEIVRTVLNLILSQIEKNPKLTLSEFLSFIDRLEAYGENIPLAIFSADEGVKVLTLHGSKGLEFDYVWIAHMDERSLMSGKRPGFVLPEMIEKNMEKKDEEVVKRQLYVAITRARRFCAISFAKHSYTGGDQELAHVVADLPEGILEKQDSAKTEKSILKHNPKAYVSKKSQAKEHFDIKTLKKIVAKKYEKRKVSVSLLNNFFECPWKWYFRNLLQLPEPKRESLEFGNAVHASIDKILKMNSRPSLKEIENIVKIEVSKRKYGNEKIQKQMQKDVLKIISKWVTNRLPQIKSNRENEKSVSCKYEKLPHLNIYGKIDLVEKLDAKTLRVTDFKTGGIRKKNDMEKMDEEGRMSAYLRQLAMYSYLLEHSSRGKLNVRKSRLEFLESKNKEETFYDRIITKKEIELLMKDIVDYDTFVKSGKWLERDCYYNSYGKDSECEYCKLAKIYTGPLSSQPR